MKILLFTEIYDCGGIDTFLINLINSWPRNEDSFVLVANSDYPGLRIIEERVIRMCKIIQYQAAPYSRVFPDGSFLSILKKYLSPILRYIFLVKSIYQLRKILLSTGSDILMVINGGYPGGDSCRAASIAWGLSRGNTSIHNFHNIAVKPPWHLWLQEFIVDWFVSKYSQVFVTVSKAASVSIACRPAIARKKNASYIYNGINIAPIDLLETNAIREELDIPKTAPLCLMLGTYEPRKGHYFLLQAFKKVLLEVPDAHLLICGFGFPSEIAKVKGFIKDFELTKNVHLHEFRTDISNLFSCADVFMVSSQSFESFGYGSVEAMAYKTPVVATDVGGIPEVVINGQGGYCINSSDYESYARKTIELLKDPALRQWQGELGFIRYQNFFRAEVMASKYAHLLLNLSSYKRRR